MWIEYFPVKLTDVQFKHLHPDATTQLKLMIVLEKSRIYKSRHHIKKTNNDIKYKEINKTN
jgi:hypothetical protein